VLDPFAYTHGRCVRSVATYDASVSTDLYDLNLVLGNSPEKILAFQGRSRDVIQKDVGINKTLAAGRQQPNY
jgi:hypothetical protein